MKPAPICICLISLFSLVACDRNKGASNAELEKRIQVIEQRLDAKPSEAKPMGAKHDGVFSRTSGTDTYQLLVRNGKVTLLYNGKRGAEGTIVDASRPKLRVESNERGGNRDVGFEYQPELDQWVHDEFGNTFPMTRSSR